MEWTAPKLIPLASIDESQGKVFPDFGEGSRTAPS
jgi:hypothetical protein